MALWRAFTSPARYAALVAGALPVLAFPRLNLEFLGWCGLVPGMLIIRAAPSAREAAVRGWWMGAGFGLLAMYWLTPSIGPAVLVVAVAFGVLWTLLGVAVWATTRPPLSAGRALAALVVIPSCFLVIEWARSWQGFGGPWDVLGASQWQHPAVLALATVGGVWLVTFALVAANTGVLLLLTGGRPLVRVLGALGAAVALAAGPAIFALIAAVPPSRFVTVALVQPGITQSTSARVSASQQLSQGLAGRRPDLIVWGESSVGTDIERQPRLLGQLKALSSRTGAQVLLNQDASRPGNFRSKVALLIGPNGIDGSYVKTRLVPFGEYIPFRGALGWLASVSKAAASNMVPGDGAHLVRATDRAGRPLPLGVLICFESAFPDMSRVDTGLGAQLIVYQTSDSTFQGSWALAQHASLGALRAAETGRPVVQAALTGDTVAFDARGRLLAQLGSQQRGVTVVRMGLPPVAARTIYDRLGDYLPWTATGIAAVAALCALASSGRRDRRVGIRFEGNFRHVPSVSIVTNSPGSRPGPADPGDDQSLTPRADR
jgi:apolipoprotein N-acyltransferase